MSTNDKIHPMTARPTAPPSPKTAAGQSLGAMPCSSLLRITGRVLARFSCGAASAVATKLAIEKYGDAVEIYYNDTGSEHEDNPRFIRDCEEWFGRKVNVLRSEKFGNIWEVFEARRFLVSNKGAPCTSEMKRIPGESVWNVGDIEIFGYTADEAHRLARFRGDNTERIIECPLIDKHLTKEDCLGLLERVGIEIPAMYRLGFRNNNCIGCVKARDSLDYWKRVRKHFPAVFERTARLERELNVTINRVTRNGERTAIYLDEIEEGEPTGADPKISCGLFCMSEADSFNTTNVIVRCFYSSAGGYLARAGKGKKSKTASSTSSPLFAVQACAAKWFGLDGTNPVKPGDLVVDRLADPGMYWVSLPEAKSPAGSSGGSDRSA